MIHHPPLTTESRFKRLTDAAAFQAMIRRVGCELVLHGHNHRSEVARIDGPAGPVPVVGVTSASAASGSKYGRARYHLIRIEREGAGWRLAVDIRALRADGTGCEPDGRIVFQQRRTGRPGSLRRQWPRPTSSSPRSGPRPTSTPSSRCPSGSMPATRATSRRSTSSAGRPSRRARTRCSSMSRCASSWRAAPARSVGRISAQVDRAHLERYNDSTGHFGCLAAEDDPAIFAALFAAAEGWLQAKGMKRATGPFSLSVNEEVGLLVDGFDSRPVLLVPYDPPYAGPRVEACGYAEGQGRLLLRLRRPERARDDRRQAARRARGLDGRVKVRTANMKMFDAEVRTLVGIFNDAWSDNWGFVPFTQAEIDHASKALRPGDRARTRGVRRRRRRERWPSSWRSPTSTRRSSSSTASSALINLAKLLWRLKIAGVGSTRVPLMGVKKKFRNHPLLGAGLAMIAIDHCGRTASGWARPRPSWAGSSRTTRRPTTSSARSAACTTRPTASTRRRWRVSTPAPGAGHPARPSRRSPTGPSWRCGSPTCCPTSAAGCRPRAPPGR